MLFYCFQGMKLLAFKTIVQFQFIILTKCTLFCSKVELSSHDLNFMDPKHLASKPSQMVILDLKALTMTMVGITLLFAAFLGSPYLYTLTISHQEAKFPQSMDNNAKSYSMLLILCACLFFSIGCLS